MEALHARGPGLALPVVSHPHLLLHAWKPGDPLVRGGFGLGEPGHEAPEVLPRALLLPLACFDRCGGRIGYGEGHFDRTVATLSARGPILAVGIAVSTQEVEHIPLQHHDRRLDIVVTEAEVIVTGASTLP